MSTDSHLRDEYVALLERKVGAPEEDVVQCAREVGRRLLEAAVPIEGVLLIHEEAMGHIMQTRPGLLLSEAGPAACAVFSRVVEAYGAAMQRQIEESARVAGALREEVLIRRSIERDLEEKAQELVRMNRELEQFSYCASHDLQAPLRQIAAFVEILRKKYAGQLDSRADEILHFIVEGADRLQTLVRDLLKFSRAGRTALVWQEFDLAELVQEVVNGMRVDIDASGGRVELEGAGWAVLGSRSLLSQVLQNLVSNGLKFRRDVPPEVRVSYARTEQSTLVSVSDNGIGIEAEYFERIFDAFQRLHPAGRFPGSGLGLALCKKIVERHGGRIWVESTLGEGSTFRFALPHLELPDDPSCSG